MSAQEEVDEHVHHAHEPFDKLVAGTMAGIAALLAIVSVAGTHYNTEKLLNQQLNSDQWAFYQAKNIRHYSAQVAQDVLAQMKAPPAALEKYAKDEEKYDKQMEEIQKKAGEYEKERDKAGRQADRFHFGEVFLEVGIVLSSLAILSKRKLFFAIGCLCAAAGVLFAATGYFV